MFETNLSPTEIAAMKAQQEQAQTQNLIDMNNMNLGLHVAQLPMWDAVGYALGAIGGNMYNNYRWNKKQDEIEKLKEKKQIELMSKQLGNYGQSLMPESWRNGNNQQNGNPNYTAQNLGKYGQSLIPEAWRNQNQNNFLKPQPEYFPNPLPYNSSNISPDTSYRWKRNPTPYAALFSGSNFGG